jgi:hypothetical protein
MASLGKKQKGIIRWKKAKKGKRTKRAKRRGTTPVFPVHRDQR